MNPEYRFLLKFDTGATPKSPVFPIYKDDLALEYEMETGQKFYRAKLSGKLVFVRKDYELIMSAPFETEYFLFIEKHNGETWEPYYTAKFMRTDCTINIDNKSVTVQPEVYDQYNAVLAGLEKEYNLITLAPQIKRVVVTQRPLLQIYAPGEDVVSCFLSGMRWEQDAQEVSNENDLINKYHFARCAEIREIVVTMGTTAGTPDVSGTYIGSWAQGSGVGRRYYSKNNEYYIEGKEGEETDSQEGTTTTYYYFAIYAQSNPNTELYSTGYKDYSLDPVGELRFYGVGRVGNFDGYGYARNFYARYITNVENFMGSNTYELPLEDIVDNNRNYKRAIGVGLNLVVYNRETSDTPTEYGLASDGKYYLPPYTPWGTRFWPVIQSKWMDVSYWHKVHDLDAQYERAGRTTYMLKDAYPVASVIDVLLQQFAPGIRHEATPEYSEFLYGASNPIGGVEFELLVTQKTNILVGEYQEPAKKAPTTLQQFLNMLRDCFQLYWHIEEGKLRIEHIQWYRNGGSYDGQPTISIDTTAITASRNGKDWAFGTSEYSFDKVDMPERYQFEWMDEVTEAFVGEPIQVVSKYVQEGKIETVSISNFTSDVDLMMLRPGDMSNDGFALLAAVPGDALTQHDNPLFDTGSTVTDGYAAKRYAIKPEFRGYMGVIEFIANGGSVQLVFYDGETKISTPRWFIGTNEKQTAEFEIPANATALGWRAVGTSQIWTLGLTVASLPELPFTTQSLNNVDYELQNGYLAMINLQPLYWSYDMPARRVKVNGGEITAYGIQQGRKQTLSFPVGNDDPDPVRLVKTNIGNGKIDKMSVSLTTRIAKTTLKYDTE